MNEQILASLISGTMALASVIVNYIVLRHERAKAKSDFQLEVMRLQWQKESSSSELKAKKTSEAERMIFEEKIECYRFMAAQASNMNDVVRKLFIEADEAFPALRKIKDSNRRIASGKKIVERIEQQTSACIDHIIKSNQEHNFSIPKSVHYQVTKYWLPNIRCQVSALVSSLMEFLLPDSDDAGTEQTLEAAKHNTETNRHRLFSEVERTISINRDLKDMLTADSGL